MTLLPAMTILKGGKKKKSANCRWTPSSQQSSIEHTTVEVDEEQLDLIFNYKPVEFAKSIYRLK